MNAHPHANPRLLCLDCEQSLDSHLQAVSYLLTPKKAGPIHSLVQEAFLGEFTLLMPEDLLQELAHRAKRNKCLVSHIEVQELAELVTLLQEVPQVMPRITGSIPAVKRDPKDDYLLAYALVGNADFLITGDHDLPTIKKVEHTKIITARQLMNLVK